MSRAQKWLRRWWVANSIAKRSVALGVKVGIELSVVTLLSPLWGGPLYVVVRFGWVPWFGMDFALTAYGACWTIVVTQAFCFTTDLRDGDSVTEPEAGE